MFTGLYPREHGLKGDAQSFDFSDRHLATLLREADYHTELLTSNTYLQSPEFGFSGPFDVARTTSSTLFSEGIDPEEFVAKHTIGDYRAFLAEVAGQEHPLRSIANSVHAKLRSTALWDALSGADSWGGDKGGEEYVDGALAAVERDEPKFAFANLMETHMPFWPPPEFRTWVSEGNRDVSQTPPWQHFGSDPDGAQRTLQNLYDGTIRHADALPRRL